MKSSLRKLWGFSTLLLFAVSCVSKPEGCEKVSQQEICVSIFNESGAEVKDIIIKCDPGVTFVGKLKDNWNTSLTVKASGERVCFLSAVKLNGDTLRSAGNYVEGGYYLTATITKDSIITKYDAKY